MVDLRREEAGQGPVVTGFTEDGRYVLGERVADGAILLTPEAALDWTPPDPEALTPADFGRALELDPAPEFLLLGTGARLVHPPAALGDALHERGIGLEVMDSRAAARVWGLLRAEERWIAAALMALDA